MERKIKMIGFDLDDTLLTREKKVSEYTKVVLQKAIDKGIVLLPATGRPVNGIPEEIRALPGIRYAVTANGARIIDIKENKLLHKELMSADIVLDILHVMEKYDICREVNFDGYSYMEEKNLNRMERFLGQTPMKDYYLKTRKPVKNIEDFLKEAREVDKLQFIFANVEEKAAAMDEVGKIPHIALTSAISNNMEINAEHVNKGNALVELGKTLGIKREEIMAFGDGTNDLMMLKEVGFGVAMSNAVDIVKDVADYITLSNNEDGVAKAIEKFAL